MFHKLIDRCKLLSLLTLTSYKNFPVFQFFLIRLENKLVTLYRIKKIPTREKTHHNIKFCLSEELRNIVTPFVTNYLTYYSVYYSKLQKTKYTFSKYENANIFSNIQKEDKEHVIIFVDLGPSEDFKVFNHYFDIVDIPAISLNY